MMLRPTLLAVLLSAAVPTMALAQTSEDLKNDEKSTADVLVYGMGYSAQRYSPLTQINKQNVSRLVPVWGYSLADLQGGESFPIVKDGVIYITTHSSTGMLKLSVSNLPTARPCQLRSARAKCAPRSSRFCRKSSRPSAG